jgi:hypothetical protein
LQGLGVPELPDPALNPADATIDRFRGIGLNRPMLPSARIDDIRTSG